MKQSLSKSEVEDILKRGKRLNAETVRMVYSGSESEEGGYAIVVPKKGVKKGVERNRIRRMIRETVRNAGKTKKRFIMIYNNGDVSHDAIKKDVEILVGKIT